MDSKRSSARWLPIDEERDWTAEYIHWLDELGIPFSLTKTIVGEWCILSADARIPYDRDNPKYFDTRIEALTDFINNMPKEISQNRKPKPTP